MNAHNGQQKPKLRRKKEDAKRTGRPVGTSESSYDDEKCRGWYTLEELRAGGSEFQILEDNPHPRSCVINMLHL